MKSNLEYEPPSVPIAPSNPRLPSVVALAFVLLLSWSLPAGAGRSITEIARLSDSDRVDRPRILAYIEACSSLGLRREAAEFLEKRIDLGEITREESAPLFEEILANPTGQTDPETLLAVSGTALRAGVRTPMILYANGTALRLAGRLSDGAAVLAQVGRQSPLFPYAMYGLGQIAAESGDENGALDLVRRAREAVEELPGGEFLAERAMRSEAELLLSAGRFAESAPLFKRLLVKGADLYSSLGAALSGNDNASPAPVPPPEVLAGLSSRQRILYCLLMEGLSRKRGRFESAIGYLDRAYEEFGTLASSLPRLSAETPKRNGTEEFLSRQIAAHRSLRQTLLAGTSGADASATRAGLVELMAQLLVLDHSILRARGAAPPTSPAPGTQGVSPDEIDAIILRIERAALDGDDVDRLVEEQARKLELLENLAHPIQRYRMLARLEKAQSEIHEIEARIRERREPIARPGRGGAEPSASRLFADLGRFLSELEALRLVAEESRDITRKHFNILREKETDARRDAIARMSRETLAFDNDRFVALIAASRALDDRARVISRERERKELLGLRSAILRRLVDSLAARAVSLAERQPPGWSQAYWTAVERGTSLLGGDQLSPRERIECAIRIGTVLARGNARWETFPGRPAGERESRLAAALLPTLAEGARSGDLREESRYVLTIVRMFLKDGDAVATARQFLATSPGSPYAGDIAVRLGHASLLAGREAEAMAFYRAAADAANLDAAAAARYMIGWDRLRRGDAEGAAQELSLPLSDPSFSCGDPSPFERSVLAVGVNAWLELPSDRLTSYPPVRDGKCGGMLLLTSLGENEERRGETIRAAKVFDALAARYPANRAAIGYETRAVEDLFRAGRDEEALSRAVGLKRKYGLAAPTGSPLSPEREKARNELSEMVASFAERKYEEGIRSGSASALSLSVTAMEQLPDLRDDGGSPDKDAELLLKRAIALIRSGKREEGIPLLLELIGEPRDDAIGERAALVYADTTIGAFERKEETAEEAEYSLSFLVEDFPSEKAAALACRAAAAFLRAGEYERAARTAEAVETSEAATKDLAARARLIRAEAFLFGGNPGAARAGADAILGDRARNLGPEVRARAKDVFLLASLKEAEASAARKDWKVAAARWEELGRRFPDAPEAPLYSFRAFRAYRLAGDTEGVARVGFPFLKTFPRREETVEIAGVLAPYLVERKQYLEAADLYASVATSIPGHAQSGRFLFFAARLANDHGDPEAAKKRFAAYGVRYSSPRWMSVYASLAAGLLDWNGRKTKAGIRELEAGLRRMAEGVEPEATGALNELAAKARMAIGEYWSEQFRAWRLAAPLEKSLAIKDRFFRRALAEFETTEREAPLELAVAASGLSGDLFVDFGKSILASEIPKAVKGADREQYREALRTRARSFFERAMDTYSGALDRLEAEDGPSDLAVPIRQRLEEAQRLLAGDPARGETQ